MSLFKAKDGWVLIYAAFNPAPFNCGFKALLTTSVDQAIEKTLEYNRAILRRRMLSGQIESFKSIKDSQIDIQSKQLQDKIQTVIANYIDRIQKQWAYMSRPGYEQKWVKVEGQLNRVIRALDSHDLDQAQSILLNLKASLPRTNRLGFKTESYRLVEEIERDLKSLSSRSFKKAYQLLKSESETKSETDDPKNNPTLQ